VWRYDDFPREPDVSVVARPVGEALAAIVGREAVVEEATACARAAVDGLVPRWVVHPASLAEVSRVLALAWDVELAVVPRGSGSALELGRPPSKLDLVLDLRRLDRVVEYNPDDLTITVEAGTTLGAVAARVGARHQRLPLDPAGAAGRTVGGLAATNASGPLRARYGTLRDLLLGVRFVQADGVVTWGGAKVVKSVSGYDVPKLMVGALGSLGVLGELTLRLHPMPEFEGTWLASFRDSAGAQAFVARLVDSTVQPTRVEILNRAAVAACGAGDATLAVAVSIGTTEEAVRAQGQTVAHFARETSATVTPLVAGFWTTYERAMAPAEAVHLQVGTLVTQVGATVGEIERAVAAAGAVATITGSGTLGSLRAAFPAVDLHAVRTIVERLRELVATRDGSVIIQRAPAAIRAGVDPWGMVEPGAFALMRGLKDEFDARRVLNPGRFVGGL
jgi:glycolate dehydrogenase FAD-binding subunit